MEATTGECDIDVAARGLVEGSSSPPNSDNPCSDNMEDFGAMMSNCCIQEERGETPGREDCQIDPLVGEMDRASDKSLDRKGLGKY